MKSMIKAQCIGLMTACAITVSGYSQFNESVLRQNPEKLIASARVVLAEEADRLAKENLKLLNQKVFRDFTRFYNSASDIKVYQNHSMIIISCKFQEAVSRMHYSTKGRWLYTIRNYGPELLSQETTEMLQGSFPGYQIVGITEVTIGNNTGRIISMENLKSWKLIKVVGDEYEIYKEYSK